MHPRARRPRLGETTTDLPADHQWLRPLSRYNLPIYITENGVSVPGESSMSTSKMLNDQFRVEFFAGYIDEVCKAARWAALKAAGAGCGRPLACWLQLSMPQGGW